MPRYTPLHPSLTEELDADFNREVVEELQLVEAREDFEAAKRRERVWLSDRDPYGEHSPHSFFHDRAAVALEGVPAPEAEERLARTRSAAEKRAVSTTTLGGVVPVIPGWIDEVIQGAVHKAAPLYAALEKLPLPPEGVTIQWVKFTAGAAAAVQGSENTALSTQGSASSTDAEPFSTVGTYTDYSFPVMDRSGGLADQQIALDLGRAYGEKVESEIWVGTGSSGRIRGLTQASPTTSVAASGQSAAQQLSVIFNTVQQTWVALGMQPDILTMAARRAGWLGQAVAGAPMDFVPDGVQLVPSPQAPVSLGAGTNEDHVFFISRSAVQLATDRPSVSFQTRAQGTTLTTRALIYGYLAFATAARPEGIGRITGLTTPTFS